MIISMYFIVVSYEGLWNFWKNEAVNVPDWSSLFDYDPYFCRIPPGFEGK